MPSNVSTLILVNHTHGCKTSRALANHPQITEQPLLHRTAAGTLPGIPETDFVIENHLDSASISNGSRNGIGGTTPQTCTRCLSISPAPNISRHILSSFFHTRRLANCSSFVNNSSKIAPFARLASRTRHGPTSRHVGRIPTLARVRIPQTQSGDGQSECPMRCGPVASCVRHTWRSHQGLSSVRCCSTIAHGPCRPGRSSTIAPCGMGLAVFFGRGHRLHHRGLVTSNLAVQRTRPSIGDHSRRTGPQTLFLTWIERHA